MTRDFIWWIAHSTANRVRRQLRQLRNPRYLIAMLFGLIYFAVIFGDWFRGDMADRSVGVRLRAAELIGPLALALVTAWWWLWGGHRRAILLSPAETNLLLPAPISRRALVRFKVMQAQVPMLFSAALFTLLTRGAPLPWPLRALSLWLMFGTLHLHQIGASLVHAAAAEHGGRGLRPHRLAVAVFSVGFVVLAGSLLRALIEARAARSLSAAAAAVIDAMSHAAPRIVLAPYRLLLAPTIAPSVTSWFAPALAVVVLFALHYVWVQRTNAAFEETAAAEGARQAEQIAQVRSGGLGRLRFSRERRPTRLARPWLPLAPTGYAAYAVFWKNVLYVQRLLRPSAFVVPILIVLPMMALTLFDSRSSDSALRGMSTFLFALVALVTVTGALMFRNDLRMDLAFADQFRTYPLRGRDVVASGVAAAALCMTMSQLLLIVPALGTGLAGGLFGPWLALGVAGLALFVLPVFNVMSVLIQNAIALLFPAWARLGTNTGGGMESIGQNIVNLIGTVIMLLLVAIPPVVLGALVAAPLSLQLDQVAVVPGLAVAILAVAGEVVLMTRWLGRLYECMDPVEAELL